MKNTTPKPLKLEMGLSRTDNLKRRHAVCSAFGLNGLKDVFNTHIRIMQTMRGSRNFRQGVGGPGQPDKKKL